MVFGIDDAIGAGITALGSIGGGYLAGRGSGSETKSERTKRKLVDKLLMSLEGEGPYSDLFNADEETFQKSFVDPAKSMFNNQIAPQIQQQYIASGQQRGTGLDDQLLRAGVDLDQILNQHMMEFQQQAQNRKSNAIGSIFGSGSGGTQPMSSGQSLAQAGAGYLSSPAFSDLISGFARNPQTPQASAPNPFQAPPRKGFEADWSNWQLNDPRWSS